ncbi:MAG: permease [Acidimicrobiia bacterium]
MTDTRTDRSDVDVERDRIGIHNEAETIRRDRIRWGPIWAGVVTAVGSYLFLQLALVATGIVDASGGATGDAIWSAIAAIVAFFIGGVTAGATAMWQGADDGVLHGIVLWFTALVAVIVLGAVGSGVALGAIDTSDAFDDLSADDIGQAEEDAAQDGAANALLGLAVGLAAAAAGGAVGAKMWPRDDAFVEVVRVKDARNRR